MLIIDTRDSDSIEKALKKYKKKFDQTGVMKELRKRKNYIKKSVERRKNKNKAAYRESYLRSKEA